LGARFAYQIQALGGVLRVETAEDLTGPNVAMSVNPDAVVLFRAEHEQE